MGPPDNLTCMAICEVINKDIKKSGNIWVMEDEDYVCTRVLLVYSQSEGTPKSDISSLSLENHIKNAMVNYGII